MTPEALEMAAGMRQLLLIAAGATATAHISLIGFHWFKLGTRQV